MKYEVAYLSQSGNTAALAKEIAEVLSDENIHLTDLNHGELSPDADVYMIGFGVNRGTVPMKIMDALDAAEGKTILIFVTCGMEPTDAYRTVIERKISPFLPDVCDYRGLFLCSGQFSDAVVQSVERALDQNPDDAQAHALLKQHRQTCGHPNREDMDALRLFISEKLFG